MLKLTVSLVLLNISLMADSSIQITATVPVKAETKLKTTYYDESRIEQDILLQTNYQGLTLSFSNEKVNSLSKVWLNNALLSNRPLDFSTNRYRKFTRVGGLIISRDKKEESYAFTIAIK
jgi:hypothetical protein